MLNNLITTALLATTLAFTSCSKNMTNTTENADAILEWSGEYMVDGCGFKLTIDGKDYKPEDESVIGDEFKQEDTTIPVIVTYTETGETIDRRCGLSTQDRSMPGIRIITIKKKQ
ncbi:hypothetical protein [Pontibacter vulgaris]|uniref:hypothetical protein n=1 Tax=Pontibacter vulgaris TaxID=2905679 RepID=UPI001FA7539A|nr:hypothetical protein [Pontibacter vulgaris]